MTAVALYFDEDAMAERLIWQLHLRGISVTSVFEQGLLGSSDEDQLRWATSNGWTVYTFNVGHYCRLHTEFLQRGEDHAGIVVVSNQRWSIGEQFRRVCLLIDAKSAEDMQNSLEYLSTW